MRKCRFRGLLCFHEWLCSEARKSIDGRNQLLASLALRGAGLPLSAEGRDYVRRLAGTSITLCELQEAEESRILVRGLLEGGAEPEWIARPASMPDAARSDVCGLRLMEGNGLREAALGVYGFERRHVPGLVAGVRKGLQDLAARGRAASLGDSLASIWTAHAWVELYLIWLWTKGGGLQLRLHPNIGVDAPRDRLSAQGTRPRFFRRTWQRGNGTRCLRAPGGSAAGRTA